MRIYNTLTRKIETFSPIKPPHVGLYTCGPTVYGTAHIGNLRTYVFEDILRRTLEFKGWEVKHVMNITDVGHLTGDGDMGSDKIEESAKRERKSAVEIANFHTREFFDDLARLNIQSPTVVLKATETIDLQIRLIQRLEAKGFTYRTSDGIYFETSKFPAYGKLSGQRSGDKKAGARVEVNTEKRRPTDFALWKFSRPEDHRQMEWPSPWGIGFPGWHIECSAMSMHELGEQFDIHTGGIDHIPVHHENEIAQSEAATGKTPFVRYWLHGEFLKLPGRRMGKSEGNSITLQSVRDRGFDPLAFRFLCLQTGYRKPLAFSWKALSSAADALRNIWNTIANLDQERPNQPGSVMQKHLELFTNALSDDLNTARALSGINASLAASAPPEDRLRTLQEFDRVLGLDLNPKAALRHISPESPELERLLQEYEAARREKRFADSDQLRKKFLEFGATVEDLPDGSSRLRRK